eukprot:Opistho-2@49423
MEHISPLEPLLGSGGADQQHSWAGIERQQYLASVVNASGQRPRQSRRTSDFDEMEVTDDASRFLEEDGGSFLHITPLSVSKWERIGLYALLVCMVGIAFAYVGYSMHKLINGSSFASSSIIVEPVEQIESIRFIMVRPLPASASPMCVIPPGGAVPLPIVSTRMSSLKDGSYWPQPSDTSAPYPASVCMPPDGHSESHTDPPGAPSTLIQPLCVSVYCVATQKPFLPFGWRSESVRAQVCEIKLGPWATSTASEIDIYIPFAWMANDTSIACPLNQLRFMSDDPEGLPSRTAVETTYLTARAEDDSSSLEEFVESKEFDRFIISTASQVRVGCAATGGTPWTWRWEGPLKNFVTLLRWLPGDPITSSVSILYSLTLDATSSWTNILGISLSQVIRNAQVRLQPPTVGFIHPSCDRAYASDWQVTSPPKYKYLPPNTTYPVDSLLMMLDLSADGLLRTQKTRLVMSFTGIDMLVGLMSVLGGMSTLLSLLYPIIQKGESARFFRFGKRKDRFHSLLKHH